MVTTPVSLSTLIRLPGPPARSDRSSHSTVGAIGGAVASGEWIPIFGGRSSRHLARPLDAQAASCPELIRSDVVSYSVLFGQLGHREREMNKWTEGRPLAADDP